MSAQLLICKFAVFTCVSFFFTDALRDSHGSLACSLSRPVKGEDIYISTNLEGQNCSNPTKLKLDISIRIKNGSVQQARLRAWGEQWARNHVVKDLFNICL